jgi:hypothetical protein
MDIILSQILTTNVGRMVISDLVTIKEVDPESANSDKWCSYKDGNLTLSTNYTRLNRCNLTKMNSNSYNWIDHVNFS